MLAIESANLPPEDQKRLQPEYLANERDYLRMRDGLLQKHQGKWVAIDRAKVVAESDDLMGLLNSPAIETGFPFIACVGEEDQVVFRVRRSVYQYDWKYRPNPIPRITATFMDYSGMTSKTHTDAITDTGADLTLLPQLDCASINILSSPHVAIRSTGVFGGAASGLAYRAKVEIDGKRMNSLIQPVPGGKERIIGRDVLNQLRVLFDGPKRELIVDP